jgi:hypothetical protein
VHNKNFSKNTKEMSKIKFDKKTFIQLKVYFDRARMYIGYIQFFLIGIVFIKSFKSELWGDLLFKYSVITIPILLLLFILFSLLIGFIDYKYGFREEEFRNLSKSNPVLMELFDSIQKIKNDISEMKNAENKEDKSINKIENK